jgi:hypothetical protein
MFSHRLSTIGSNQFNPNPFPLHAFPPVMAGAVHDVATRTKAPMALVASSVLSASALACQRDYAVRLPHGDIRPLSLYLLLIAKSGERKSAADGLVYGPVRQIEKEHRLEFLEASESYRQKIVLWRAVDKTLQRRMIGSNGEQTNELLLQLEEHYACKPVEPSERRYVFDDITPAAIVDRLHKSPSASLMSDDGRTMLMGAALSNGSLINRAWDGALLRTDRAGSGTTLLDSYALSLWCMVQPGVFHDFMNHDRGLVSRETGFLARCLVAFPQSTQGSRQFDPHAFQPEAGLRVFHRRLEDILRTTNATRQVIDMDPLAIDIWGKFSNVLELDLSPNMYLADLTDFASKVPENATRIAANFHVMRGRSGPLQVDDMKNGSEIAEWYLHEAKRLFGAPLISQEESDADTLAQWLQSCIRWPNMHVDVPKADIYHYGPNALRGRRRLDPALQILECQGRLSQGKIGKRIIYRYVMPTSF